MNFCFVSAFANTDKFCGFWILQCGQVLVNNFSGRSEQTFEKSFDPSDEFAQTKTKVVDLVRLTTFV